MSRQACRDPGRKFEMDIDGFGTSTRHVREVTPFHIDPTEVSIKRGTSRYEDNASFRG